MAEKEAFSAGPWKKDYGIGAGCENILPSQFRSVTGAEKSLWQIMVIFCHRSDLFPTGSWRLPPRVTGIRKTHNTEWGFCIVFSYRCQWLSSPSLSWIFLSSGDNFSFQQMIISLNVDGTSPASLFCLKSRIRTWKY